MAIFHELPVIDAPLPQAKPISPSRASQIASPERPDWFRIRPPGGENYTHLKGLLRERKLHTVCEEARCPNITECWSSGTATFMLGGDTCTRACRFCAIKTARKPPALDTNEPFHVAESVSTLGLKYVVLTSVDRDDLEDGGAEHFSKTIKEIKRLNSSIIVEALVPDFRGNLDSIQTIVASGVDVYAHNVETVERLQYRVRDPRANYRQSLQTLKDAKKLAASSGRTLYTKTSIMLGLGEERTELETAFSDLRSYGVDVLTLGQYLRPTPTHLPVNRFISPEEFKELEVAALKEKFLYVASGPLVRSSYRAGEFFIHHLITEGRQDAI